MSERLPLCSSRRVIAALKRLGFTQGPFSRGSHQSFYRRNPAVNHTDVCVIPLGKSQIPRGTLKSILEQAHVTADEFLRNLK